MPQMVAWRYPNWVPNTPWMSPLPPALSSISLPKNWFFDSFEFYDNTFGEFFSPSRRTASPNGSDWESEAYGLTATINTPSCFPITLGYFPISVPYFSIGVPYSSIRVPYLRQKKSFFDFTLPSSLFHSECLYLLVFTDGRENKCPSRLPPVQGPLFLKCEGANPKKGG